MTNKQINFISSEVFESRVAFSFCSIYLQHCVCYLLKNFLPTFKWKKFIEIIDCTKMIEVSNFERSSRFGLSMLFSVACCGCQLCLIGMLWLLDDEVVSGLKANARKEIFTMSPPVTSFCNAIGIDFLFIGE